MKNYLFACGVALLLGGVMLVGCGYKEDSKNTESSQEYIKQADKQIAQEMDLSQNLELKQLNNDEFMEFMNLYKDEKRSYVMKGMATFGDKSESVVAYVEIDTDIQNYSFNDTEEQQKPFEVLLSVYGSSGEKGLVSCDSDRVEIGNYANAFVIRGDIKQCVRQEKAYLNADSTIKDFSLRQDIDKPLSRLDTLRAKAFATNTHNGEVKSYTTLLGMPFLRYADKAVQDSINLQLGINARSKDELLATLKQRAESKRDKALKQGLEFNSEDLDDVWLMYVDSHIMVLGESRYIYGGGAHGLDNRAVRIFGLKNGDEIRSDTNALIDSAKANELLHILSQKLMAISKDLAIFEESLPLQELPKLFFIESNGISFVWQPYEIAPYSSGDIQVFMSFADLKNFVNKESALAYLFE